MAMASEATEVLRDELGRLSSTRSVDEAVELSEWVVVDHPGAADAPAEADAYLGVFRSVLAREVNSSSLRQIHALATETLARYRPESGQIRRAPERPGLQ